MVLFAGSLLPYTQYVIYFTSCFMLIPTGRDIVAVGYPLLPGDDKLLPAFCNGDPNGCAFMWKVFGSNFVMLSVIKLIILNMGMVALPLMIAMACYTTFLAFLLITHAFSDYFKSKGADFSPFLALFTLETIAWYLTIFF